MAKNQENAEQGTQTMEAPRPEQSPMTGQRYGTNDIARRAYQRFLERGGEHGHDMDDWFEAERELQAQDATDTATPPHGDELGAVPEQAPVAARTATPRGKGGAPRVKKVPQQRPDRAADQH